MKNILQYLKAIIIVLIMWFIVIALKVGIIINSKRTGEIIIVIILMAIIIISFNNLDSYFQGARIPAAHKSEFYKHIKPESK